MSDSYAELPYSKFPYPATHPDRLATLATLHGLPAPSPAGCRVLELGCGAGGNLIPLAYADPQRRCVGLDRAPEAIADGRAGVDALGLDNVELLERDLLAVGPGELGEFDFVIAHGVYSWVPPQVREAVLALIASHLAADGIAFVSYNAQPGGTFRRVLGSMGAWHSRAAPSATARAETARELFEFLLAHRASEEDAYGAVLARELPRLIARAPSSLIHDELDPDAQAFWFHEFAAHAGAHALQYVGESSFAELHDARFPDGVESALRAFAPPGRLAFEQYSDMVLGRKFRQTLLCRAGRDPVAEPDAAAAGRLRWAAPAGPIQANADGSELALLDRLAGHWPHSAPIDEHESTAALAAFRAGRAVPRTHEPEYATEPGERPLASALARLQAKQGTDVTSLRHENVHISEPAARRLLALLDGTRDRAAILADLTEVEMSAEDLDANLRQLGQLALLHA